MASFEPVAAAVGAGAGGLAGLAAALAAPPGGAAAAAAAPGDDDRKFSVEHDSEDKRYRDFRDVYKACRRQTWPDFPVPGPDTYVWCGNFVLEHGPTPMARHSKWKAEVCLPPDDPNVMKKLHKEFISQLKNECNNQ